MHPSCSEQRTNYTEKDDDNDSHSTDVAFEENGKTIGIAKDTNLLIVKAAPNIMDTYRAFDKAFDHITRNNRQEPSVVLRPYTSIGSHPDPS